MLTQEMLYNAITLYHVNKKGWEMKSDLEKVLAEKNLSVDKMLNMSWLDYLKNANEVMATTQTGYGKEWVQETILSSELIERLKLSDSLLVDATIKLMDWKTLDVPVRGWRVRMTLTTELVNAPTGWATNASQVKKLSTPKITLTAKEMKITIYYSDTFLEDSVIAIAQYVLDSIADAYESSIHEVLINGDTATGANVNINIIDANTSTLADWDKTDFLAANGWRKIAISKSATVDAWGNLAIENIRSARAKMWAKWINPAELRLVPDLETYLELLNLSEVETIEKFGWAATIVNGKLAAIDWIKIINREELLRATANGTISATPANNTKGQILLVHTPSINVWIRRGLTTELSRYAEDGITWVTWTARVAVTFNDVQNNVLPTSPAALIVNV